jgi:hypothetical protein
MKYLKTIGLAIVAATALMALAGAGTASATVFCKNNLNTEKCSEPYPVGTVGDASLAAGTTAVLETLEGQVLDTCTAITTKETLSNAGSATTTVTGNVPASNLTFSACTRASFTLAGGQTELHHIAGTDNGTVTGKGFEVTVNTALFGSCVYGLGSTMKDWGTVVGGSPGSMTVNAIVSRVSGICPNEARMTAKFVNTEPKAGYVAAG